MNPHSTSQGSLQWGNNPSACDESGAAGNPRYCQWALSFLLPFSTTLTSDSPNNPENFLQMILNFLNIPTSGINKYCKTSGKGEVVPE